MKETTDVVIIGGGIIGCSTAYHLAQRGFTDVFLLEKGALTSGTTFHSVGLVSQFRSSAPLMYLINESIQLYDALAEEVGQALGWNKVGSLRLASSTRRWQVLERKVTLAQSLGLDVDLISPKEAISRFPHLNLDGVVGAAYIADDGWIEPNGITMELARRARQCGVEVRTNTLVTGIKRGPGDVWRVQTAHGEIETPVVVNAAGQWAPQVAAMVGIDNLPVFPIQHQYLLTKPIPGHELPPETPVVRDPDNLFYLREEVGGCLVGGFELEPKAWFVGCVPWDFSGQLLAPDWDLFEPIMAGALARVPMLDHAEVIRLVNGPDGVTPDGGYILGPVDGVPGFYLAAGMSLNGIAGAGGVGNALAGWIIDSAPWLDLSEFSLHRFDRADAAVAGNLDAALDTYRHYYHLADDA